MVFIVLMNTETSHITSKNRRSRKKERVIKANTKALLIKERNLKKKVTQLFTEVIKGPKLPVVVGRLMAKIRSNIKERERLQKTY